HVAFEDVKDLGKFVHRSSSKEHARTRHPLLARSHPRRDCLVGVLAERTELQHSKHTSILSHPHLSVENRTAVLKLHRDREQYPQRGAQEEPQRCQNKVEAALDQLSRPPHIPSAVLSCCL